MLLKPSESLTGDEKKIFDILIESNILLEKRDVFLSDVSKKKQTAKKTAEKFAKTKEIDVEPMSPEEMKELIAKTKEGEGDDDCLMCGS